MWIRSLFFSSGNEAEAIRLIEERVDASIPGPVGRLPMYWAAKWNNNRIETYFFRFRKSCSTANRKRLQISNSPQK